jgi:hypothetical protein
MLAPPNWLPSSAAHEAQRLLSVESVDAALVVRLATDERMRSVWREVTKHNKQGHTRSEMSEAWKHFRPPLSEQFTNEEAALALFFWYTCFFAHLRPTVRTIAEWGSLLATCRDEAERLRASAKVLRDLRLMPGGAQDWFQLGEISTQFQNIYANQIEEAADFYDEISENIINQKTQGGDSFTVERDFGNRAPRAYIRLLAPETRMLFGTPLYGSLATVASVALGCTVTTPQVREWARTAPTSL